jgi:peptidoglycan/xylan/chitin deacetylase (PgdA/CDA1 family)
MDRMRVRLQQMKLGHCVAFVVGREAQGNEDVLSRWLESGYELGNHSFLHVKASALSAREFADSLGRCDELLRSVGAFDDGRTPWFRFPFLDRGGSRAQRAELSHIVKEMGYRVAHASLEFFDHCFDEPLTRSRAAGDEVLQRAVGDRYLTVADEALHYEVSRARKRYGNDVPHVCYCHFGSASELHIADILANLRDRGVAWCSLDEAQQHAMYRDFEMDLGRTDLVTSGLPGPLHWRLLGLGLRSATRLGIRFASSRGPRMPYL